MSERPCMNPASVLWPERTPDPVLTVAAQRRRYRREDNVIILNRDWRPAPQFLGWGADDGR